MAFIALIIKSAFRNKLRSILTALGVALALIAFLFLRTVLIAWNAGADNASADRMVVRNKISIIFPLPTAYFNKVKAVSGVSDATWANWFGGVYKDPKNFFAKFAVDAESYTRVYPEMQLSPQEMKDWLADRTGCVVGAELADKYGFKVGDEIPIAGDIYPGDWKFHVRGIYHSSSKAFQERALFFHWKYLNEAMPERRKEQLGLIIVRVADRKASNQVAHDVDTMFANSPAETRTETEKAFQLAFLSMVSTVLVAIKIVSLVVLLILSLILGNTISMATRERTTEYAVLRAIGFKPGHIIMMVLGEGLVIAALGAALGLAMAPAILSALGSSFGQALGNFFPEFHVQVAPAVAAVVVALVEGMLAAAVPAWRAGRKPLVDALRRVE